MSSLRWRLLIAAAWLTCSGCNGGSDVGLPDEPLPSGSLTGGIGGKGGGAGAAAGKAGTAGVGGKGGKGGKGGVGAKGGAGGGSGSPGAAGAGGAVPDWLADPAIWKKFESPSGDASTGCPLFVATTGIELRPLEWTPCGAGCESTSPTTLYPSARMVPSTSLVNGVAETFANVVEATNYGLPTTSLMYWRNLRTGDVHGAVRRFAATTADGTCTVANAWGNDPRSVTSETRCTPPGGTPASSSRFRRPSQPAFCRP